ncbi:MAG: rhomboid family intramembrane serine protease [Minicystis sp.]
MGKVFGGLGNAGKQETTLGNGVAALIGVNLLFFLLDNVLGLGFMRALYLPLDGASAFQYVTSLFCHASWLHLSSNLVFLYLFGKLIEEQEGTLAVLVSYLICGIGGNVVSEIFLSGGAGLGASGAVFGLFVVSVLIKLKWNARNILEVVILGQFVIAQIISEAKSVGASDGIGHLTHLGGALTGGVLVFGLSKLMHRPQDAATPKVLASKTASGSATVPAIKADAKV